MSGHSKWSQIKRQKGVADAQRGQLFTKLSKEIIIAARQGGPDPNTNFRLRLAVQKARDNNMPMDNIDRAVKRASGGGEGAELAEITYEGFGPAGTAVLVDVATDNRNRTVAEIRHMFSKHGGNMGEMGSVGWMFERKSQIVIDKEHLPDEDAAMNLVLEVGADDLKDGGSTWEVISAPESHVAVLEAIQKAKIPTESAEIAMIPKNLVKVEGKNAAACIRLSEALDDQDDVQNVYSNFDIDESEMETLAG